MRVLIGSTWAERALDYARAADAYRIQVQGYANVDRLTGIYFVRAHSLRILLNYFPEVGAVGIWRKVASRLQERARNEKFVSFGVGRVLEAPATPEIGVGAAVAFLAPGFPACVERVSLPGALIGEIDDELLPGPDADPIRYVAEASALRPRESWWQQVRAWSPYSGASIGSREKAAIRAHLPELARSVDWSKGRALATQPASEVMERTPRPERPAARAQPPRKTAVLFGFGHYAKTNILPNVRGLIDVQAVHEVDPIQIPASRPVTRAWDTSPVPRDDADYDVYFIAGYHHSHAPLSVTALERGAYAVAEKPLAVDRNQLQSLLGALEGADRGYFGCFHKRYSPLNDLAIQDLRRSPESPIDYHCVVYEVPLPDLHWYRWPNSKSRIVSNGCHWIDHFLYLNGYKEVTSVVLDASPGGTLNLSATLQNGAYFTMVLTDTGSERIGLQEYVELRAGEVTVKMLNNSKYLAENSQRVLRRARVNKLETYQLMYKTIAERIARGERGDTLQSLRVSTQLMLDFEDLLDAHEATRQPLVDRLSSSAGPAQDVAPEPPAIVGLGADSRRH